MGHELGMALARMTGRHRRSIRPARSAFVLATPRGRRSPKWAYEVRTAAGETFRLTGLQRAGLLWITSQVLRGRHEWRIRDLAEGIGCSPGTASKVYRALRLVSMIAGPKPLRGRLGHATTWLPRPAAQRRDAVGRTLRWPTSGNDSTLTTYGGFLSRAGVGRAWRRMDGSPPSSARPPGGGPAPGRSPRARGRAWPPAYVDETCPSTGRTARIRRSGWQGSGPDVGVVFAGRCPRCRRAHVATLTLVAPDPEPARRPTDPFPTPDRRRLAETFVAEGLETRQADELRERYLGWIRTPVYDPPLPPLVDGPLEDLATLVASARSSVAAELAAVAATRQLVAPAQET